MNVDDGSRASFWPARVTALAGAGPAPGRRRPPSRRGWDEQRVRSFVCGHDAQDGRRLSFLPLPSVGHPHADGMIRRVLVVAPPGEEASLEQLRPRLIGPLTPEEGHPTAAMVPCPRSDPVIPRYTGGSRAWSTVTPAILAGHVSRGGLSGDPFELTADHLAGGAETSVGKKAAKVVRAMLEHAGLPVDLVELVTLTRVPLLANLPHAMRFRPPANLNAHQRTHVRLRLRRPVNGPLALGIGRFRGFGTLVADQS